jgi:hypothetical protein
MGPHNRAALEAMRQQHPVGTKAREVIDRRLRKADQPLSEADAALRRQGYLTIAPPAAPPIGWSSYNPHLDWDEDTEDGFDHSEDEDEA